MMPITGSTITVGVIGDPVRHSLSPTLHNAAFAALGVDAVSTAFPVADHDGAAAAAVDAMRTLGIRGLSVTMPHKEGVAAAADRRSATVEALGAANCLVNDDGVITAHSTDGDGLVRSLEVEFGITVADRDVVVVGAGGAARAAVDALARAGAAVTVVNRSPDRAAAAAVLAGERGQVGVAEAVRDAAIVINATPVGMADVPGVPLEPALLNADHVVVDLIYHPRRTALLEAAEAVGATAVNGVAMLLHQAAVQLELWTGQPAPIGAMRDAVGGEVNDTDRANLP